MGRATIDLKGKGEMNDTSGPTTRTRGMHKRVPAQAGPSMNQPSPSPKSTPRRLRAGELGEGGGTSKREPAALRTRNRQPNALGESFKAASTGVLRCVASQRNMKIHVLSALMVMIVGMALPLDLSSRVALLFAVAIVFFAEILNTGLEAIVDLYVGEFHRLAMLAKDAAAGGVLVLAVATVLILTETLHSNWDLVLAHSDAVARSVLYGVPLVAMEALGLFVIRRGLVSWLRFGVALFLLAPLVMHSQDPIYAFSAVSLIGLSFYARHAFPRGTGRGAPPRSPKSASA